MFKFEEDLENVEIKNNESDEKIIFNSSEQNNNSDTEEVQVDIFPEEIVDTEIVEAKEEVKEDIKKETKEEFKEIKQEPKPEVEKIEKIKSFAKSEENLRKNSLFNAEADLYRVKFDEYAGIPDCIVNEIFAIEDGKGKISIEEAIIMLMNLIPTAKSGINEAKTIQDAIYISRIKIAAFLFKECTFGFTNIPDHSRINLSNKIKADCDKNQVFDVLYDYQLMRLSGYLPLG